MPEMLLRISLEDKMLFNNYKKIEGKEIPSWVRKAFWKSIPGPNSRPPSFVTYFKGKTFKYKVIYEEKGTDVKVNFYRKFRRR